MYVRVCVREREREREREDLRGGEAHGYKMILSLFYRHSIVIHHSISRIPPYVLVCVCVRARERARENQ